MILDLSNNVLSWVLMLLRLKKGDFKKQCEIMYLLKSKPFHPQSNFGHGMGINAHNVPLIAEYR